MLGWNTDGYWVVMGIIEKMVFADFSASQQ
jgi:hypothetical protein